mmetsp:Transcript_48043/g.135741  ORF Transcript_48043/g.135741 Transcript_48043/m.135741 type:complete len:231 (-) Transcript_48043:1337-2029(-)
MDRASVAGRRFREHRLKHPRLLVVEVLEPGLVLRPPADADVNYLCRLDVLNSEAQPAREALRHAVVEPRTHELPDEVLRALRVVCVDERHQGAIQAGSAQRAGVEVRAHLLPQVHLLRHVAPPLRLHQERLVVTLPPVDGVPLEEASLAMLRVPAVAERAHEERPRVVEAPHAPERPDHHRRALGIETDAQVEHRLQELVDEFPRPRDRHGSEVLGGRQDPNNVGHGLLV